MTSEDTSFKECFNKILEESPTQGEDLSEEEQTRLYGVFIAGASQALYRLCGVATDDKAREMAKLQNECVEDAQEILAGLREGDEGEQSGYADEDEEQQTKD